MCACLFDLFKTQFAAILIPSSLASMAYCLTRWIPSPIPRPLVPFSKPLNGSKFDSAFYSSEVGRMSTSSFSELSGKK